MNGQDNFKKCLLSAKSRYLIFYSNIYFRKGKMVALLKQKSKVTIERKPRITYDVSSVLKRPREPYKEENKVGQTAGKNN